MSLDMYAEEILDHYRNPRNFGKMKDPDASFRDVNPLCGDQYEFQVKIEGGRIKSIMFNGDGCAISMASASMLTERCIGKSMAEMKKIDDDYVIKMLGIEVSPTRMKCALLPMKILKVCLGKSRV